MLNMLADTVSRHVNEITHHGGGFMLVLIGAALVFASVFGGFAAMGGNLDILWQPFEALIIIGAAVGAFIIGNPASVLARMGEVMRTLWRGPRHGRDAYVELIGLLYTVFKTAKMKGHLALERHIEEPEQSSLFAGFPQVRDDPVALGFLTDYLRLISLGTTKPAELEALMDQEIDTHAQEHERTVNAIQSVADATPALGIIAAVLGVIKTMGSINEPPEVLGMLLGGALVGTFLGVFLAYGFLAPMAASLRTIYETESKYLQCIKVGLLAHLNGYAPAISVEFSRKALMSDVRPTFQEVEDATLGLQPV